MSTWRAARFCRFRAGRRLLFVVAGVAAIALARGSGGAFAGETVTAGVGMVAVGDKGGAGGGDTPATEGVNAHGLFTQLLGSYVQRGRVDYRRMCGDPRFAAYLSALSATDPQAISDENSRLAFWLNAYNAFTLQLICDNYPVASIKDLHFDTAPKDTAGAMTAWDKPFITIGGSPYTLNEIENDIIRPLGDRRVHFALVCAAKSCPPLRAEAYEGTRLDEQLDDQGRIFLSEASKNYFEEESRVAYLSQIMNWYAADFGDTREAVLLSLAPFLPREIANDLRANPGAWQIEYTAYDWSLND